MNSNELYIKTNAVRCADVVQINFLKSMRAANRATLFLTMFSFIRLLLFFLMCVSVCTRVRLLLLSDAQLAIVVSDIRIVFQNAHVFLFVTAL